MCGTWGTHSSAAMYAHMADSPLEPCPSSYPDPGAVLILAVFRMAFARSRVSSLWHSFFSSSWCARDMTVRRWYVKQRREAIETWLRDKTRFGAHLWRVCGYGRACLAFDSHSGTTFAVSPEMYFGIGVYRCSPC